MSSTSLDRRRFLSGRTLTPPLSLPFPLSARHKSLLDYFQTHGFTSSFDALKLEAGQEGFTIDPKAKYAGLLEKKWTSVIRLQKKVSKKQPMFQP